MSISSFFWVFALKDQIVTGYLIDFLHKINSTGPFAVFLATLLITGFYFRFSNWYRHNYISARQEISLCSTIFSFVPILLLCVFGYYAKYTPLFSFCIVSSILSVAYPLLIGAKMIAFATFFPTSLLLSCLVSQNVWYIYILTLAIPTAIYKFRGENRIMISIFKYAFAPYLCIFFISLLISDNEIPYNNYLLICSIWGVIGSFTGFIFERIFTI